MHLMRNIKASYKGVTKGEIAFAIIACTVVYGGYALLFLFWFLDQGIASPGSTGHGNFGWGILHGLFAFPSLIAHISDPDKYSIYQEHNNGASYAISFVLCAILSFKFSLLWFKRGRI